MLPLIWVVPPALVATLAAVTAALNLVVPVLLTVTAPRAVVPPTTSVKVTLPLPVLTVRALVSPVWESTVLSKVTAPLVVPRVMPARTSTMS